jgi:hypothetical protein
VLVTHTCNLTYLGGWEQEDRGPRPAQGNSSWELISKIARAKWIGGRAQEVEHQLCKHEVFSSNPRLTHTQKKNHVKERKKEIESIVINLPNIWGKNYTNSLWKIEAEKIFPNSFEASF